MVLMISHGMTLSCFEVILLNNAYNFLQQDNVTLLCLE